MSHKISMHRDLPGTGFPDPSHPRPRGCVVKGLAQGRASGGHQGIRLMAKRPCHSWNQLRLMASFIWMFPYSSCRSNKNIHQKSMQRERMLQTCSEELAEWLALLGSKSFSPPAKRCAFLSHDMWNLWPGAKKRSGLSLSIRWKKALTSSICTLDADVQFFLLVRFT